MVIACLGALFVNQADDIIVWIVTHNDYLCKNAYENYKAKNEYA